MSPMTAPPLSCRMAHVPSAYVCARDNSSAVTGASRNFSISPSKPRRASCSFSGDVAM